MTSPDHPSGSDRIAEVVAGCAADGRLSASGLSRRAVRSRSRSTRTWLAEQDVFVNVIGGLTVEEPAVDLAVAIAIASSNRDRPVVADMAFIGEVGLNGELRAVGQLSARMKEAAKLGFRRCLVPRTARPPAEGYPEGIEVIGARSVQEALQFALLPDR